MEFNGSKKIDLERNVKGGKIESTRTAKICSCGRQTYNKDGVCLNCKTEKQK